MPFFSSLGERQVCKPRTELFLQPLNFKRKRLQIHFARDEIFLFSLEKIYRIGPLRSEFLIQVSCQGLVRSQYQISPPGLVLGYPRRQIMAWGDTWAGVSLLPQKHRTPERGEGLAPSLAFFLMESAWVVFNQGRWAPRESLSKVIEPSVFFPVCWCQSVLFFSVTCFVDLEGMNPKPLSFPELVTFAAVLLLVLLDGTDSGERIFN